MKTDSEINVSETPWSDTPATSARIVSAISRISAVLRAGSWQFATAEGLNPTQVDILELLLARTDAVRLSWLAQQLSVTNASASDSVSALVTKGFVEKGRAFDDGRAVALKLSPSGRTLAQKINESMGFALDAVAGLPGDSQQALYSNLLLLIRRLQMTDRFPEIRTCLSCVHFAPKQHDDDVAPHHCNLVNVPLPSSLLRLDCAEHRSADEGAVAINWRNL